MARPVVLVLGAMLAGSVAANVYQWRHRGGGTTSPPAGDPRAAEAATAVVRTEPADAAPRPRGAPPPMASTCEGQLTTLGDKLAKAEASLEERLTFEEKFDRSPPSPDAEARLTPLVATIFEKAPDGYSFDVSCRGEICDVTITEPEKGDFAWDQRLQQEVYHAESRGHVMYAGKPSHDPITKEALMVRRSLVRLNGADTADGMPVLQGIVEHVRASGAAKRCAADGTRGYLTLQLWLDGEAGTITYEVGGTLASSASGQCVLHAVDQAIAAATIPPRARGAVLYHTVQLPP
jgi:hypothetical protein